MPIFSLDNGRLTPADSTLRLDEELRAEAFIAVRDQVVELLARPIFPVAWLTETGRTDPAAHHTSLVALEPAGEIVTVDVIDHLTPASLMDALSRAGRHSDISRGKLAGLYPRGTAAFRRDWDEFVSACPSRIEPGPRLIVLAFEVADEVRTALDSLLGAGVELFRVSLHDSRSGLLVSLDRVRPNEASFRALVQSLRAIASAGSARPGIAGVDTGEERSFERMEEAEEPAGAEAAQSRPEVEEEPAEEVAAPQPSAEEAPADPQPPTAESAVTGEPPAEEPQAPRPVSTATARPMSGTDRHRDASTDPAEILRVGAPLRHGPNASYIGDDGRSHWEQDAAAQYLFGREAAEQGESLADDSWDPGSLKWPTVHDENEPTELERIAAEHGELELHARSRRRRLNARARIDAEGRFILEDGTAFPGPDEAIEALLGRRADGWKMWKTSDGKRLSELRPRQR